MEQMDHSMDKKHYGRLLIMAILSFLAMYALMYAMVDSFANVFPNVNQFYMAGLMTAPMVILEVILMGAMYSNKKWNVWIIIASIILLIAFWLGIRQQVFVSDEQFLKSMIPHHAGAILMCEEAPLHNLEIRELCQNIIKSQKEEIDQMKRLLGKNGQEQGVACTLEARICPDGSAVGRMPPSCEFDPCPTGE